MRTKPKVGNPFRMKHSQQQPSQELTTRQWLALNDGTLDTYPKIMDAVRSFVRVSRADGDPTDVDAMTK